MPIWRKGRANCLFDACFYGESVEMRIKAAKTLEIDAFVTCQGVIYLFADRK